MAPKKRVSSSTKKANKSHQASKYGIQHFFDRHSQTQTASTSFCPIEPPKHNPNSEAIANSSSLIEQVLVESVPCPADEPQSAAIANDDEISSQISPDFTRNAPLKRFKFSPSLMIKQSQDDISDDVTWKVSPVNEKLRKLTAKQLPRTMRIFSDRPRPIASCIHPCMQVQNSICSAGSLEKWLSSPTAHASGKSVSCSRMLSAEQETEACHCNDNTGTNSSKAFQTPPSSSYDPSQLTAAIVCNGLSDEMELGQLHRKAFLELLDQVEDVIIDKAPNSGTHENTSVANCQIEKKCDPTRSRTDIYATKRVEGSLNDEIFLVLEVTEKHKSDDPSHVKTPYKVLRLLNELTGEEKVMHLFDEWFYSIIGPGDTVNAIGEFDQEGKCIVNRSKNFVIVFPEILVSGTRVASSFHCPRRAVLDQRLKASEQSVPALIGTLLHQIFQAGLLKKFPTRQYLEEFAARILQKNLQNLYASNAIQNETFAQLLDAIPRIQNWIKCFRDIEERRGSVVDFGNNGGKQVLVTEVMDIEEMAWAPKYGLKGIIDASLCIRMVSDFGDSQETIVPLEFKSGKITSQTTTEHHAQVILYTLLMSERYLVKEIDAGLLYYLFTDETRGVKVQRSDLIGLIMRRNELASDLVKASTSRLLPPMLKNPMVCKSCRHLNSCTIYHKAYGGDQDTSGLGDLFDRNVGHLTTADIEFLKHWDHLIDLEAKTCRVASKEMRACRLGESSSSCLSPLVLDVTTGYPADGLLKNDRYVYHFIHQNGARCNREANNVDIRQPSELQVGSFISSLKCGDFVIISTESGRPAIANGMICSISQRGVSVSLSKLLRLPGSYCTSETADLTREVWRIDKDEIASVYATMRFNLVELFFPRLQNSLLRKVIVGLEPPRFDSGVLVSQDPAVSYVRLEKSINDDQRRAIQKILSAKNYSLILGMPGTGKTSTMVHAVKALLMRGQSILLTSYTNSAVDNLLIKLKTQEEFCKMDIVTAFALVTALREEMFLTWRHYYFEEIKRKIVTRRAKYSWQEVVLTPTHLAIVMEYAAGGELFEEDIQHGRFSEDEDILAIFFLNFLVNRQGFLSTTDFRISTMFWEICHRDLKLENTLLDGNPTPQLKICDFGYSKSALLHSQPKSTVATPAYIASEVLSRNEYDGKVADVWSCGVTLYVMLIFVFHPAANTGGSILHSDYVRVSADCRHLLSRIFVSNPLKVRVFILFLTIQEEVPKSYSRHAHEAYHDSGHKKRHPWFLKNMPRELVDEEKYRVGGPRTGLGQSVEEIMRIIKRRRLRTKLRGRRTDRNRTGSIPMMWMLMTWRTVGSSWRRSEERGNKTHKGDAMKAM
ncbi:hypothetical protein HPP92_002940 [Vanilla planifolia]|uniref:DNA helicase n=1 Tax=Vanilla planifolia TaxID=51239 RepID=A0A835VMZ0_VANPL|nr:hypothetical protein HPP92_002940 [Vanilla planifolia]